MEDLPVNAFDLILIATMIVIGLIGMAMGIVKTSLYALSWIGAAAFSFYAFPTVKPIIREHIETPWIADGTAVLGLFVIGLAVLIVASSLIGSWIRSSSLNALDRSLGMVAGLLVAAFFICVGYIGYAYYTPPKEQPDWVREARALPLVETGAVRLLEQVPEEWLATGRDAADRAKRKADAAKKAKKAGDAAEAEAEDVSRILQEMLHPEPREKEKPEPKDGYSERERKDMERLVEGSE